MTKTLLLASTALLLSAVSAHAGDAPQVAQAPVPTGPTSQAPLADAAQRGVLIFAPEFFLITMTFSLMFLNYQQ
ncbi:MAG: hypothetical protein ACK4M2_13315 [Brevundimonas sp.]